MSGLTGTNTLLVEVMLKNNKLNRIELSKITKILLLA